MFSYTEGRVGYNTAGGCTQQLTAQVGPSAFKLSYQPQCGGNLYDLAVSCRSAFQERAWAIPYVPTIIMYAYSCHPIRSQICRSPFSPHRSNLKQYKRPINLKRQGRYSILETPYQLLSLSRVIRDDEPQRQTSRQLYNSMLFRSISDFIMSLQLSKLFDLLFNPWPWPTKCYGRTGLSPSSRANSPGAGPPSQVRGKTSKTFLRVEYIS